MTGLLFLPVVLSLIVLGAHFLREGNLIMVAVALVIIGLVFVRRRWAAYTVQTALLLGAAEWVRTLVERVAARFEAGQPVLRLVLILGGVALVTALSTLVFRTARLKRWYEHS
ncbi:conserved protein of unknown function [Georgfuchsia toluolica]|uniref:Transmembrane protein n=1 Tax=Georgfuchsia toluolica TaxID=424218 RepID=A0A916J788_9PROT|nr:hypothetical protein [Georgfuchsia toluolica]CAG4885273.1 conserved protein of unknown function [Georgfuchsia toluolica]